MPFPVDRRFVERAEQKLGARLPSAYVDRMVSMNGGTIELDSDEWELHPVLDEHDVKRMARTCNDILRETNESRAWLGFPPDALAIASNGAGDRLVLRRSTTEQRYEDTIYVWDHETRETRAVAKVHEVFGAD
jgi:hypothetical protein